MGAYLMVEAHQSIKELYDLPFDELMDLYIAVNDWIKDKNEKMKNALKGNK